MNTCITSKIHKIIGMFWMIVSMYWRLSFDIQHSNVEHQNSLTFDIHIILTFVIWRLNIKHLMFNTLIILTFDSPMSNIKNSLIFDIRMSNVKQVRHLYHSDFHHSNVKHQNSLMFDIRIILKFVLWMSNVKCQRVWCSTFLSFWRSTFRYRISKQFDVRHSNVEYQNSMKFDIQMSKWY